MGDISVTTTDYLKKKFQAIIIITVIKMKYWGNEFTLKTIELGK